MQRCGSTTTHGKRVFGVKINWQDDQNATYVYVQSKFGFKTKVDWSGRCETPAGSAGLRETPQERATRRLPAARGKRVPEAEINPAGQ
ncbi:hypothetical protein [Heyndrickxia acidicola]|uniref:Uncharacterized protein n=1 Tax=Heyndrickxia acidicola TaxID=209389 RepID=A0ABU6MN17_9BACI|nr:hypothetical protein [Heyndrickxia acidicola]MED1205910.1 hypothetical protein [Heyndrickxia acidicola]